MNSSAQDNRLSLRAWLLRAFVYSVMRPALARPPDAAARLKLEKLARLIWVPRGMPIRHSPLAGVPVEWVGPAAASERGLVLYLHGGAYVTGSPATHRGLTARLARAAGVQLVVPDYRLAPEHPHPAAVDDAFAVYNALLLQGCPAKKIIIAGDSAGGGIAMALALRIKAAALPQPAGIVLLSPYVDMTLSGQSMQAPGQKEWLLTKSFMQAAVRHYMGQQALTQPSASPLFADLSGLAPLFIQVGTDEVLLDDSTRLALAATQKAVPVTLQIWPRLWHVWQLHGGQMPEADRAIAAMADFVRGRLAGTL